MSTYTQIIYQIVFSTKNRDFTLKGIENRIELYKYIWGILKNNKCVVYRINGIENHLHIATHIHPTVSLSTLVKDIKVSSSLWIKQNNQFPDFIGWAKGYGAFTYNISQKEALVGYVKNQVIHHKKASFRYEYIKLLKQHGIKYASKYVFSE